MPSRAGASESGAPIGRSAAPSAEATAFIRFCYRRRRTGWPELYDEMCAVASRRLYNGWGFQELADVGIGFSLFETPTLAAIAREIALEETERRTRTASAAVAAETKGVPAEQAGEVVEGPAAPLTFARATAT